MPEKYLEGRKLDIVVSWPIAGSNFWFELNFLLPQLPGWIELQFTEFSGTYVSHGQGILPTSQFFFQYHSIRPGN